jgi:alanine racemase
MEGGHRSPFSFARRTRRRGDNGEVKSWVEISKARLVENLRAVQSVVGAQVETLAVVKANGYGHDVALVAKVLVDGGARWLGVTDVEEGLRVRAALGQSLVRVLVMTGMEPGDAFTLIANGLTPVIWTVEHIAALEQAAKGAEQPMRVHLEIDSGMSRQGVAAGAELAKVLERLADSSAVVCEGVLSHLSCSESGVGTDGAEVTSSQCERFARALEQIAAAGVTPEWVSLGNTSAVDEGSTMPWIREVAEKLGAKAMVRTGLAIYGDSLELEGAKKAGDLAMKLQPVLTWKTHVIGLRDIEAGTTVGYGATFTAKEPMRLALLPVGYADGFRREASSGIGDGWVCIEGKEAAVVGRVSMNLTVVDVTGLPDVAIGNDVVLLGEGVSADDHAWWCDTIPYEILCGIRAVPNVV